MSDDLKPCPFCGGEAQAFYHNMRNTPPSHHIECRECGNGTCHHEFLDQAIAAWNTRADTGRIETLEAENATLKSLVRGWHYLAVGPDEMGDYYTQKMLIKASEPYASPALVAITGKAEQ